MLDTTEISWRQSLAGAVTTPSEIARALKLDQLWVDRHDLSAKGFPLLVTRSFLRRMRAGDELDPLLIQILPSPQEFEPSSVTQTDAVGDLNAKRAPGLLQKYRGRALILCSGACAIHCRYCFRRHYPYFSEPKRLKDFDPTFEAIEQDESIREVILSGGDPLMIADKTLASIIERLDQIDHVEILRIHSRLPIVLPDRITPDLIKLLGSSRLKSIMVVHANHANEVADDCADALRRLTSAGVVTLNQSVLLRGVNDSASVLSKLSRTLIGCGVMPYYLHQLDRVSGVDHFAVPDQEALSIIDALRCELPGYLVPRLVREIAGQPFKTPIF